MSLPAPHTVCGMCNRTQDYKGQISCESCGHEVTQPSSASRIPFWERSDEDGLGRVRTVEPINFRDYMYDL